MKTLRDLISEVIVGTEDDPCCVGYNTADAIIEELPWLNEFFKTHLCAMCGSLLSTTDAFMGDLCTICRDEEQIQEPIATP